VEVVLSEPDDREARGTLSEMLAVPGYKALFLSSWLWHTTRWGGLFSSGYLVTQLTDAPIINQLVGASIFAPMLFGGLIAGALSDRLDRRRVITVAQLVLIPISLAMFVVVQAGLVRVWMVFPFMIALGIGGLVNMTAQRALIYETVGPRFAGRALPMEAVGSSSSNMAGALVGGALIGAVGIGAAFGLMALTLCLSAWLLRLVPQPRGTQPQVPAAVTVSDQMRSSVALLRRSPSMASMLGVTVVFNLFYFAFIPLVPVMAERFGASALLTGVLGAAVGAGQLLSGLTFASFNVTQRGRIYVGGVVLALCALGSFAMSPHFALGFIALIAAGAGSGGFGSMQSVLVIEAADDGERGAALGLLSTAIGVLPLGMLLLGVSAELLGAQRALLVSSCAGLTVLAIWLIRRPAVLVSAVE
jgi:MFS family permease